MSKIIGNFLFIADCRGCGWTYSLSLPVEAYTAWVRRDVKIQDAFPDMDRATREFIKTQICGDCWTEMFAMPEVDDAGETLRVGE